MAIAPVGTGSRFAPALGGTPAPGQEGNLGPNIAPVAGPPIIAPGTRCSELTNAGKPCGAAPAKGLDMCVGHQRKAGLL